jgi:hypothetical protein
MISAWFLIPAFFAGACIGALLVVLCAASRNGQGGDE